MLKAILVDDEKWVLNDLLQLLTDMPGVKVIKTYLSALEAWENIDNDIKDANVYFLDINMPHISGLVFAELLRKKNPAIKLVFITAYEQHAIKAFEINVTDYLLKPIERERLQNTLARLNAELHIVQEKDLAVASVGIVFFGRFDVIFDNVPLKWASLKAEELVAYLAAHSGKAIHRERIYEDLWGALPDNKGLANLASTVFRARQSLAVTGNRLEIVFHDDCYRLMLRQCSSDWAALQQLIADNQADRPLLLRKITKGFLAEHGWLWAYPQAASVEQILQQAYDRFK